MLDIFTPAATVAAEADEGQSLIQLADNSYPVSRKLTEVVKMIEPGKTVHWVSNGDWSMHELLMALLEMTGPAYVHMSTYAFSEKPARVIADLVASKQILGLWCLIDSRVDVRSASALSLVQSCARECRLIDTHAKVTVVSTNDRQFVVIGSANYTTNKRFEAGVIIEDFEAAVFHQKWIHNELIPVE